MPLMMLLTSCGEGGSFLRVNNSLGLASFIGVGLLVGACLGFIYAIMPRIDIITGTKITSCEKKPVALLAGLLLRHVSPFWRVYAILADNTTIDNNRPYGKLYFSGGSAD